MRPTRSNVEALAAFARHNSNTYTSITCWNKGGCGAQRPTHRADRLRRFQLPFSALASIRAGNLERVGSARVDWRAVEHAPEIPPTGNDVIGELRSELQRELDQIRSLLTTEESDRLALPTVQSNTERATAAYAAAPDSDRPTLRARLFAAYWREGADLADTTTLARLGASRTDERTAARWRHEWLALTKPIVPMMILPDGYVSRGLGALARLAQLATSDHSVTQPDATKKPPDQTSASDPADLGGESPCYAHLLEERRD